MRILVVEDNPPVGNAVRAMLECRKYAVDLVTDGERGLDYLLRDAYDAAILDVGLPKCDGFEIARRARQMKIFTPILMLTSRDGVEDRVTGLDCGADDYLVKPFAEEELVARVRAIVRRARAPVIDRVEAGGLVVDCAARNVAYLGRTVSLGSTEFRLLEFLARNVGITFSRSDLLERIWDYDFGGSSNIVDVYVSQLRRKLKKAGAANVIETVWGVGYRFVV
jgi:two-component system, OmpR family, copper resistance phosphate regulon response regulator CusR